MVSSQSKMIKESRTREGDKEIPTDSPETCSLSLSFSSSFELKPAGAAEGGVLDLGGVVVSCIHF